MPRLRAFSSPPLNSIASIPTEQRRFSLFYHAAAAPLRRVYAMLLLYFAAAACRDAGAPLFFFFFAFLLDDIIQPTSTDMAERCHAAAHMMRYAAPRIYVCRQRHFAIFAAAYAASCHADDTPVMPIAHAARATPGAIFD